jgi:hypothetical protein
VNFTAPKGKKATLGSMGVNISHSLIDAYPSAKLWTSFYIMENGTSQFCPGHSIRKIAIKARSDFKFPREPVLRVPVGLSPTLP